jgi:hypothetical protein
MASSARATLRPILATATFAVLFGGFAGVAAAQDAGGYRGPMLTWTGKSPAPTEAPAPSPAPAPASSDDGAATYAVQRHAAPAVEAAPERAPPPPAEPQPAPAAYRPAPTPPVPEASAPPTIAESAPAPTPYIAPPTSTKVTRRALAAAAPSHPVAASAAATAAPIQSADATPPAGSPRTHVRFYSLHRAYGMTPDPIAMPAKRPMVLVGPPDAPASQSQNGADDDATDGGKPAPHSDGQGAGGAADPSGN